MFLFVDYVWSLCLMLIKCIGLSENGLRNEFIPAIHTWFEESRGRGGV